MIIESNGLIFVSSNPFGELGPASSEKYIEL